VPTPEYEPEAVRQQLERALASANFVRSERQSRFLRFVVERHLEGRDNELKESVIALEVFGDRDYDPKQDSIVRTEAGRLRSRLAEYYGGPGSADPVIFELPKGGYVPVFRQVRAVPVQPKTVSRRWWPAAALAGCVAALAVIAWLLLPPKTVPITIAVLPLQNLNQDPATDYFADGLTDEIIRNLSIIDGLAVRSQTSSFVFKGKPRNLAEVGKQLAADYILEGSVLRSGQQLRIDAQLVRVRDDVTLWSGKYDKELTDVFVIQEEISRGIVNSLRVKLGRGRRHYETSVEAYDHYLRARAVEMVNVSPLSGTDRAIDSYEAAVAKDPAFAPAYAGLAMAYAFRSGNFKRAGEAELMKMRAAAEKAVQLDPLSGEAHVAMGVSQARDGKWEQSEKSFRRAIEFDPNSSMPYNYFALYHLLPVGRIEEAVHELQIAEKADPASPQVQGLLAYVLISAQRYEEAAGHCRKSTNSIGCLGRVRMAEGKLPEAIQLLGASAAGLDRAYWGHALGLAGRREEAEKLASSFVDSPFHQALVYSGLGDKDRSFKALDACTVLGPVRMGRTLSFPEFALLRGDPRLKALRKKVGLPE
jgi:TolB-like protein/Flp pilus assembly protein TadD